MSTAFMRRLPDLLTKRRLLVFAAAASVVAIVALVAWSAQDTRQVAITDTTAARRATTTEPATTTTVATTTTTTTVAPTSTSAPAPRAIPTRPGAPTGPAAGPAPPVSPAPAASAAPREGGLIAFGGLGVWLDVWDWSPSYTGGAAAVDLGDIDRMRDLGVRTIYIQTGRYDRADDVLDRAFLLEIIDRAHNHGMYVVGWYLPTFEDVGTDLRRLMAAAQLPVDAIGVDVESRLVADHGTRSQRLLDLSAQLNHAVSHIPIAAITLPPVVTEIINPAYWPGHPWAAMTPYYDVWMPMGYWGNRTPESGWREGYRYTAENIDLIRRLTGNASAVVHPVGGVGSDITPGEVDAMVAAARDRGAVGGSIYDYLTTHDALWPALQGFLAF